MLAEQLFTFAQDFIAEYQENNILGLMQAAISILQRKASITPASYANEVQPVRDKCEGIMLSTRFDGYPGEWKRVIANSEFAMFLPGEVAKTIIRSLPSNKDFVSHSSEMQLYRDQCNFLFTQANDFIRFAGRFRISRVTIPDNDLGIIVEIPRRVFDNEVDGFSSTLKKFSDLIATLSEVVSGKRCAPSMLYASTSDPSIIFSSIPSLAGAFLSLYSQILEASIKTLEIAKAFGIIRDAGHSLPDMPDLEETMLRDAIDRLIAAESNVDDAGRREELHAELLLRAKDVVPKIKAGARLSLAATTKENTITQIVGDDGKVATLTRQAEIVQSFEIRLEDLAGDVAKQIAFGGLV